MDGDAPQVTPNTSQKLGTQPGARVMVSIQRHGKDEPLARDADQSGAASSAVRFDLDGSRCRTVRGGLKGRAGGRLLIGSYQLVGMGPWLEPLRYDTSRGSCVMCAFRVSLVGGALSSFDGFGDGPHSLSGSIQT